MERVNQIDLRPKPSAITTLQEKQSQAFLVAPLMALATARQATVSGKDLELYARRLSCFPPNDVAQVLDTISHEPREEGETAFPSLPGIESRVREFQVGRRNRELREARDHQDASEFDKILGERMEDGETEEGFCKRFPSLAANWQRWKQQGKPVASVERREPNQTVIERARVAGQ